MALKSKLTKKLGGLAIAGGTRLWMRTLDYQVALYDPSIDPTHADFRSPVIFLLWHEYIPFLFYLRGHNNISMLVSQHGDAEWLAQATRHMGFGTVRGSSSRGGVAALKQMFEATRGRNLAITPDGPRGPRRRLAQGCIYLSSKLGIPLVPIGLGYDRPWRVGTWDRFAIPRPYSRARAIAAPFVQIPPNLHREELETHRQAMERLLLDLTLQAESWATSGKRIAGQVPLCREPSRGRQIKRTLLRIVCDDVDRSTQRRKSA